MPSAASWRGRRRLLLLPAVVVVVALAAAPAEAACFPLVFSFGDSLKDTGNYRFFYVNDTREAALRLPYGETYFHRATGRFSDGRLIVDLIELIGLGAKTLLVPGNHPIGCVPKYLPRFQSNNEEDYEPEIGCLRWMNEFSQYRNELLMEELEKLLLMEELEKLRRLHPDVTIIYADYYEAAIEIFRFPELFGIEEPWWLVAGEKDPTVWPKAPVVDMEIASLLISMGHGMAFIQQKLCAWPLR